MLHKCYLNRNFLIPFIFLESFTFNWLPNIIFFAPGSCRLLDESLPSLGMPENKHTNLDEYNIENLIFVIILSSVIAGYSQLQKR